MVTKRDRKCQFTNCYADMRVSDAKHFYGVTPKDLVEVPGSKHICVRTGKVSKRELECFLYWSESQSRHYRIGYTTVSGNLDREYIALSVERETAPRSGLYERVGDVYDLQHSEYGVWAKLVKVSEPQSVRWKESNAASASNPSGGNSQAAQGTSPQPAAALRDCSMYKGLAQLAQRVACEAENVARATGEAGGPAVGAPVGR
jgi:hypothetical protein